MGSVEGDVEMQGISGGSSDSSSGDDATLPKGMTKIMGDYKVSSHHRPFFYGSTSFKHWLQSTSGGKKSRKEAKMTVLTQSRFLDYALKVEHESDVPVVSVEDWVKQVHPYDRLAIQPMLYEKFIYNAPVFAKTTAATQVMLFS